MIEIKGLCKSYDKKKIYDHLDLSIKEQQVTYILGTSGYGKTTLLRILAGLEGYEKGVIEGLAGKKVSFLFQEDRLMLWLSVEENILYVLEGRSKEEKEERLIWSLELLGLSEERKSAVQTLSGGMKRRVAMARALVYESEILLLDEPFKGLDEGLTRKIVKALSKHWQERKQTVLIVGHDRKLAYELGDVIEIEKLNKQKR